MTLTRWLRNNLFIPILIKTRSPVFAWFIVLLVVAIWHGGTLDYFYWAAYWFFIILTYLKIQPWLKKINVGKHAIINQTFMIIIMTLSTLCFMATRSDWSNLLTRIFTWSKTNNFDFILKQMTENNSTLFALFCFIALVFVERSKIIKSYLIPILFLLTIIFAELRGSAFFYLGL